MDKSEAFKKARSNIETRFGVTFDEYMSHPRTQEVQTKINEALKIETEKHRNSLSIDKENLIQQIDDLNDLCEGVMAVPMPAYLDREKVKKETAAALKWLLSKE